MEIERTKLGPTRAESNETLSRKQGLTELTTLKERTKASQLHTNTPGSELITSGDVINLIRSRHRRINRRVAE